MSEHLQAVARFPGVERIIGGTMTWAHGTAPGVCTLTIAPQLRPPALVGTLEISYDGRTLSFPECRAVQASYRRDSRGRIVSFLIEDWRWKWRFGEISGRYNQRTPAGEIKRDSQFNEKTPRQLAAIYFEAMGQRNYDVKQLPDEPRPFVEHDLSNPAQSLDSLCDLLGCRVAPQLGNIAKIVRLGGDKNGASDSPGLPEGPTSGLIEINESLDPPEKPDAIEIFGGPAEFQHDFELEAVALEASGEYVLLNDVSYKPAGGWTFDADDDFHGIANLKDRKLAQASVYRAFRVKIPTGDEEGAIAKGLDIPGYSKRTSRRVTAHRQLVFLNRQCVEEVQLGVKTFKPMILYGAYEGENNFGDEALENTVDIPEAIEDEESDLAKKCIYTRGFSIDADKSVVLTSSALVLCDGQNNLQPAKLRLRVAVNIRDEETDAVYRHSIKRDYGTTYGTKPMIISRPEIVLRSVPKFKGKAFTVVSVDENEPEVEAEANYYLDIQDRQWQTTTPAEATYGHILSISPDGLIHNVVWTFGGGQAARTMLARNTEFKDYVMPYRERRQFVNVREVMNQFFKEAFDPARGMKPPVAAAAPAQPGRGDKKA